MAGERAQHQRESKGAEGGVDMARVWMRETTREWMIRGCKSNSRLQSVLARG